MSFSPMKGTMESDELNINEAIARYLRAIAYQVIDSNEALCQIALHLTYLAEHSNKLLDELRTLNSAVARMEDFHYSAALKGSPSA